MAINRKPTYSVLYAAGDSLTDYNNFIPLITPPGMDSALREELGYSLSITNRQGDLDGDGEDDGVSYAQTLGSTIGLAREVVNVAVATSRAIGSMTLEDALRGSGSDGGPSLFDAVGADLPPERLAMDINLTAQTDRIIADFVARGRPADAAVTLLVGANDLAGVLADKADIVTDGLGTEQILALVPDVLSTIAGIVASAVGNASRMANAGIENILYLTSPVADVPLVNNAGASVAAIADAVIGFFNLSLKTAFEALDVSNWNADVDSVDVARLVAEVEEDPSSFNVVDFNQPYFASGGPDAAIGPDGEISLVNPRNGDFAFDAVDDRSFFFDQLHLNDNAHDLIAMFVNADRERDLEILADWNTDFDDSFLADPDVVFAGSGNDTLTTNGADDVAFGGTGNDSIDGGSGDDILAGGSGNDVLSGGRETKTWGIVTSRSGIDVLNGGTGNDVLRGEADADALFDGLGRDTLDGGTGDDLLMHVSEAIIGGSSGSRDLDRFTGGAGDDLLVLVLPEAAQQALVIAAAEGSRGSGGALGSFAVDAIGIIASGVERVVVMGERGLPSGFGLNGTLEQQLVEADLWSVALPARENFSVASAIYDSDLFVV